MTTTITEYRVRDGIGRNFIRVGDYVRVPPSRPGRHDGYIGKVTRIDGNADGQPVAVNLAVALTYSGRSRHPQAGMSRATLPASVLRIDQTRIRRKIAEAE